MAEECLSTSHLCSGTGGSFGQSRFICQVLCTGMQGIYALVLRGASAKVGSSAKFCILVCKASLPWYWGSIGQSRFICQVLCTGIQGISALILGGSIGQSRFICQVLCSGMQVISALVLGGHWPKEVHLPSFVYWYARHLCSGTGRSISQSRFICLIIQK